RPPGGHLESLASEPSAPAPQTAPYPPSRASGAESHEAHIVFGRAVALAVAAAARDDEGLATAERTRLRPASAAHADAVRALAVDALPVERAVGANGAGARNARAVLTGVAKRAVGVAGTRAGWLGDRPAVGRPRRGRRRRGVARARRCCATGDEPCPAVGERRPLARVERSAQTVCADGQNDVDDARIAAVHVERSDVAQASRDDAKRTPAPEPHHPNASARGGRGIHVP